MLKMILKNIWFRRRRNAFLLVELVLVCILTWVITDPVVTTTYNRNLPDGFRTDGLYKIKLEAYTPGNKKFQEGQSDSVALLNYHRIVDRLKVYPGVQSVSPLVESYFPFSYSSYNTSYHKAEDTLYVNCALMYFVAGTDFFTTCGMEGVDGGMTAQQLSDLNFQERDVVVTSTLEKELFQGHSALNLRLYQLKNDSIGQRIVGVVRPFRLQRFVQPVPVVLKMLPNIGSWQISDKVELLVRVRDGISEDKFLYDFRPWMKKQLQAGNFYCKTVKSYTKLRTEHEEAMGIRQTYRINITFGVFFLVNLCLGVAGTFWMQTRSRREEIGVMLAFGGTPSYIMKVLFGEGVVLATVASLSGFFIYLNYVWSEGLYANTYNSFKLNDEYWINHFGSHFVVVSVIVYIIILAIVLLGIYIPARKISSIPPTEALRDE